MSGGTTNGRALVAADFSPLQALADKHLLLIGTTGFLAKVMLAMLLERFAVRRISVLIRPQKSKSARERFFDEVIGSEMMAPIRARLGPSLGAYLEEKVEVVPGDISEPGLGIEAETAARLQGSLDLVINSAGLVNFNPPLDNALETNTLGALEVARFALGCRHPRLVHISTCFVTGNRSGWIREDVPVLGYFPRQDELEGVGLDWQRELRDLQREIATVKARTDDAALEAKFRREALDRLDEEGKRHQERTVRAAMANARRRWVAEELIRRGVERAQHWGWPNIYTYTKALGEQAVAAQAGLQWAIVRPAIVESALEYPFPGWNEGMNTSAPLAYMGLMGQVIYPSGPDLILDIVPVDYVSSATLAASAALIEGESSKVYQVATGDVNPSTMDRVVTLVGLARRRRVNRDEAEGKLPSWRAAIKRRIQPLPLPLERYQRFSAPALKRWAGKAREVLGEMEPERYGPFGGLISQARKLTQQAEDQLTKVIDIFDLFLPFIYENRYVFRTEHTRGLFSRMNEADRALLPFAPDKIDWRHYWLEIHIPGLEEWVFPKLEESGPKRIPIPKSYRDLAELFESTTEEHARRVAYRILRKDDVADSYSYREVRRAAGAVAAFLAEQGVTSGDRVALAAESRPEWGISYFGIIMAGATAVPFDPDLSASEMANLSRAARAKGLIASEKVRNKLADTALDAPVWSFDSVFARTHELGRNGALVKIKRSPDDLASIIFTSGTTGVPKGVMLSDRNFTALVARMSALFDLQRTDSLVSVLPLHHTFEFSAGFLMPLAAGASVTYLEERTPELLSRAFHEVPVTAMVGVPAVWESLHRKIMRELGDRGPVAEWLVKALMRGNRWLRDHSPWNVGRWVFRPMHDALGGRVRWMVSGGAALSTKIYQDLRGLGFSLYEGYGLTEAAPVISVGWPREKNPVGSVGWPLPGLEVKIDDADEAGVGELIARGPTIMAGYLDDPATTAGVLRNGWLHTGDLGRLDDKGRVFIVGRKKDVIIDTSGKNVYPDEIEELYGSSPLIKELSVVGIPAEQGTGERVAALVVPDYEASAVSEEGLSPEQVRDRIREHFREVGSKQPFARRVKLMHFWEHALPRTSTRKIKRSFVQDQILRLERTLKAGRGGVAIQDAGSRTDAWVRRTVASIAQRAADEVGTHSRLIDDLGFDSLMQLELLSAMEAEFPHARVNAEEMGAVETVADVVRLAARDRSAEPEARPEEVGDREEAPPFHVPAEVAAAGKSILGWAQRETYRRLFEVRVEGQGNVPANTNFIVAANHSSHLDMGLAKYALGGLGGDIVTLAAKDYFFDDPARRMYFENFTNLLPIDRHGSLKKSLRLASEALRRGSSLLIFPEGTRSRDGSMTSFKPSVGYLALSAGVDVVPMFLGGSHDALPVGAMLPRQRKLEVRIGPAIVAERMREQTRGMARAAAYRYVAEQIEAAVRRLGGLPLAEPSRRPSVVAKDDEETGDLAAQEESA